MQNPDNLVLPDFLLADLYKNSLVLIDGGQPVEKIPAQPKSAAAEKQWYLGSNLQKITLLVNEKDTVYVNDNSLQFLSSILGACKLNLGDVAIVNYNNEPVTYPFLKENISPANLILFGVSTQQVQLPFTIPNYQVQKYDNCNFLLTPPLEAMLDDSQEAKLEKSKLWLSLKKMFNI